jgi:V8-like Glu-specific endopeptidase
MKLFITGFVMLFSLNLCAQAPGAGNELQADQWKKAVVKIESIQQRYNFDQVDVILHNQTDTIKRLSQHEKYNTQGELLTIKDTIRGTGILLADGNKIYLVTAKHLIKATENAANNVETINDLISIKTNVDNKASNDIGLMNLSENRVNLQPFIFSSDQNDIGIISFQKESYKPILAYLKLEGCVPITVQSISNADDTSTGDEILTVGFPALQGNDHNSSIATKGTIASNSKTAPFFIANLNVYPGNSGGPVIENNKLIGILSFQSGISTNIDATLHPYDKASSATVIKASAIPALLRELQRHEKNTSFK